MPRTGGRRRWGRGRRPARGARTASRMPGTPRMVPTETTGLDGGRRPGRPSAIASRTPGAGVDVSWPDHEDRLGRHLGPQPHPVLLEVDHPRPLGCRRRRRRCGSRPGRRSSGAAAPVPWTVEASCGTAPRSPATSGKPASSIWVRTRWVAMSRSPRPNHVGSTPYSASSLLAFQVSSRRPHPRSGSMPSPRVYITVSRSGQTLRPWIHQSSAVLATTVTSASGGPPGTSSGREAVEEALQEPRAAHPAGQHGDAAQGSG